MSGSGQVPVGWKAQDKTEPCKEGIADKTVRPGVKGEKDINTKPFSLSYFLIKNINN